MKFSIITPTYNMERWIKETALSVLGQSGEFEIEYIIIDGDSTDNTLEILNSIKKDLDSGIIPIQCRKISLQIEKQKKSSGMYGAINEGFEMATGNILAWINADDVYHERSLEKISNVFKTYHEIKWLKGITDTIDDKSRMIRRGQCRMFHQDWIAKGIYGREAYFIEQDSVFWRKELWSQIGHIPSELKYAGDYWLWIQMAQKERLWSLNSHISCFRKREGQLSKSYQKYKDEQNQIRPIRSSSAWIAKSFFTPQYKVVHVFPQFQLFFLWLYSLIFRAKMPVYYLELNNDEIEKKPIMTYSIHHAS